MIYFSSLRVLMTGNALIGDTDSGLKITSICSWAALQVYSVWCSVFVVLSVPARRVNNVRPKGISIKVCRCEATQECQRRALCMEEGNSSKLEALSWQLELEVCRPEIRPLPIQGRCRRRRRREAKTLLLSDEPCGKTGKRYSK